MSACVCALKPRLEDKKKKGKGKRPQTVASDSLMPTDQQPPGEPHHYVRPSSFFFFYFMILGISMVSQ